MPSARALSPASPPAPARPTPRLTLKRTPMLMLAIVMALPGRAGAEASPAEAARWLADADRFRMGEENLLVETRVTTADKERRYTVHAQSGRRSLVVMRSPAEQGQKVLMLGDDFWLVMPGTQRPMRITPMQKLLGDASTGDIATLRWSEDYAVTAVREAVCDDARACWQLDLAAQRTGVSYARIALWIGRTRHEPLRADLYVQSDRLAKQARFIADRPDAPTRIDAMVLTDQLGGGRQTRIDYLSRRPHVTPPAWFNPMVLARQPMPE